MNLLGLWGSVWVAPLTIAQFVPDSKGILEAQSIVESAMQESHIVGLCATVSNNGYLVWSRGFGYADLENLTPANPATTRFRVGSISKPVTATAMAMLMEAGKIDLDREIQDYVPDFPRKEFPITVRNLAGHTSGIRYYREDRSDYLNLKSYASVMESLEIFKDDPLLFEPGTQYKYTSYGYVTLSAVVEGAANQPFLEYLQGALFEPVGMERTMADRVQWVVPGRAEPYEWVKENSEYVNAPFTDNSYKWAGGGLLSTSEDLARFGWAFESGALVSSETKELMIDKRTLPDGSVVMYGLGWTTVGEDAHGRKSYGHEGGAVGGKAMLRVYPEEKIVVSVACNVSQANLKQLPGDILNALLGDVIPTE